MKLGFRKKKITSADDAENLVKNVSLSVFVGGEENLDALFSALPAGAEIIPVSADITSEKDGITVRASGTYPAGKYILFAHSDITGDAAEFFSSLAEHDEELVLFKKTAGFARGEESPDIAEHILRREKKYRLYDFGFALSSELYSRALPFCGELPEGNILLPAFLLAKSTLFLAYAPFQSFSASETRAAQQIRRLVNFFADIRRQLDPLRYRYLFNIVCECAICAYASLVKENNKEELRDLDVFLKQENLALRVAADERAPLNFIRSLRKRDFAPTLSIRAGAAIAMINAK